MKHFALLLLLLLTFNSTAQFDEDDTPLIAAVKANNLKEVKRLVESGVPINDDSHFDADPIDIAVAQDYRDIVLYLLSKGATSRENLYNAVSFGDVAWVKTLLSYKFYDSEAMIPAVESNNLEMVKTLIAAGFPIDFEQKRRTGLFKKHYVSPIEIAMNEHYDAIALELVKAGAPLKEAFYDAALFEYTDLGKKLIDLNRQTNELFLICAKAGNKTLLDYCLSKGANANATDLGGNNALLLAAENGRKEMYDYCITKLGLSPNSLNAHKENALMLSFQSSNAGLITQLLNENQNLEMQNTDGETALFYADRCEVPEIFSIYLMKKININHADKNGNTVLLKAAFRDDTYHVFDLIEKGADVLVKNKNGQNILSGLLSSYYRGSEKIKNLTIELINQGVDVKVKTNNGADLSFVAIQAGDLELLKLLHSKGAKVDGRDGSNNRSDNLNKEIIQYVLENVGDPNAKDNWSKTYLCSALDKNDVEFAAILVKYKADVNMPACFMGETLLHEAIEKKDLVWVQFLVESKADLYTKDTWSKNAMELALEKGNQDIINYLRSKGAMTKDELNKREVERAKEMQQLHTMIEAKDLAKVLSLINKYPEAVLSEQETQQLSLLAAQTGSVELVQICLERYKWDLNAHLNFEQQTILHVATKNNLTDFAILIVNKGGNYLQEDAFGKTAVDYAKSKELKTFFKNLTNKKKNK
jgi:uncharacterized protein